MEFIAVFFIFLFGLVIGSFLNVVIFRLETEESIAVPRSHCMDCRHSLFWYDLIPVMSFLALWGKCRYCKKPISRQYPLIELATAILFVLTARFFDIGILGYRDIGNLLTAFYYLFVICALIIIFVYDFKHYIIPDEVVFLLIIAAIAYNLISQYPNILASQYLISAFLASGFFLLLVVLSGGKGMGMGDVKFAFALGLILGWPLIAFALFVSFVLGSIIGLMLVIFKKKNFKSEIPFGPFLAAGGLLGLFWGREIMQWYLRHLS